MNKTYRNVWNAITGTWTAVAETAKSRSKGSARVARSVLAALALGSASIGGAFAAEDCETEDGKKGSRDAAGVCRVAPNDAIGAMGSIGTRASASELEDWVGFGGGSAVGIADASGDFSIALGANTRAEGRYSVAIGGAKGEDENGPRGAYAVANSSVALGVVSEARANNSVALGASSLADRENTVSVGAVNNRDGNTFTRQIVNVGAGTQANDAVIVEQLAPAVTALGGGAAIDPTTGAVTGPTYNLTNGQTRHTVGDALSDLDGAITTAKGDIANNTGAIQTNVGDIATLNTNVSALDGRVTTNADEIATLNTNVSTLDGRVTTNEGDITNLSKQIADLSAGGVGIVTFDQATSTVDVATAQGGTNVNFAGTDGARTLTGVSAGQLSATSTDAVNGAQLHATNAQITANADAINTNLGAITANLDAINANAGAITANLDAINANAGAITANLGAINDNADAITTNAGSISANTDAIDANATAITANASDISTNATAITTLNTDVSDMGGRVTTNEGDISNLSKQIADLSAGGAGIVTFDQATGTVDVATAQGGTTVNFAGTDGTRTLTGVAAGDLSATSTDAVNGAQLHATNEQVARNTGDITTLNTSVTNLDGRVSTNEGDITHLTQQIADLSAGGAGIVTFDQATGTVDVATAQGGTTVNFAGKDGARTLTGVAAGDLSTTSTDAVNGAQLHATNEQVAKNTGDITTLNTSVTNLDGRVSTNETHITQLQQDISNGAVGLVKQDANTGNISVAGSTGGNVVDFAGAAGDRRLSGIANGVNDNDALTVAQMKAMGVYDPVNDRILGAIVYDDNSLATATLGGVYGTTLNNLAPGLIAAGSMQAVNGGQLFDMEQRWSSRFDGLSDRVDGIENGSGNPVLPGPGTPSDLIGSGSGENSVVIGEGSTTDRDDAVGVGGRQIVDVADGTEATDAINKRQLDGAISGLQSQIGGLQNQIDSNRRDAAGGTATAVAIANLPQASLPGESVMSIAGGTFDGESATAIGVSTALKNGKWLLKASGSMNTRGSSAVGAGVGYRW